MASTRVPRKAMKDLTKSIPIRRVSPVNKKKMECSNDILASTEAGEQEEIMPNVSTISSLTITSSEVPHGMVTALLTSIASECSLCTDLENDVPEGIDIKEDARNDEENARNDIVDGALCMKVKGGVYDVRCEAEGCHIDDNERKEILEGEFCMKLRSGIPEACGAEDWVVYKEKLSVCTQKVRCRAEKGDLNGDENASLVDNVEEDLCYEEDTVEHSQQNVIPREGRHSRILEHVAVERQHNTAPLALERLAKASKIHQSSIRLQKRLEKIYHREKMIRDLDTKLKKWKKSDNTKSPIDDASNTNSSASDSVRTGPEVTYLEVQGNRMKVDKGLRFQYNCTL